MRPIYPWPASVAVQHATGAGGALACRARSGQSLSSPRSRRGTLQAQSGGGWLVGCRKLGKICSKREVQGKGRITFWNISQRLIWGLVLKHELIVALSDVSSQFWLLKLTVVVISLAVWRFLKKTHELYVPTCLTPSDPFHVDFPQIDWSNLWSCFRPETSESQIVISRGSSWCEDMLDVTWTGVVCIHV